MKIKFRRKGEVISKDIYHVPKEWKENPEGREGVDLTGYPVILKTFKKRGHEQALELQKEIPGVIIVYSYSWSNGFGDGVLFPENFNPKKVRFFKSDEQIRQEKEKEEHQRMVTLYNEVNENLPGVRVFGGGFNGAVTICPEQIVWSQSWGVVARSLDEAKEKVAKATPQWKKINEQVIARYKQITGKDPENEIEFRTNPYNSNKYEFSLDDGVKRHWEFIEISQ
jgi:hypothetical protein